MDKIAIIGEVKKIIALKEKLNELTGYGTTD